MCFQIVILYSLCVHLLSFVFICFHFIFTCVHLLSFFCHRFHYIYCHSAFMCAHVVLICFHSAFMCSFPFHILMSPVPSRCHRAACCAPRPRPQASNLHRVAGTVRDAPLEFDAPLHKLDCNMNTSNPMNNPGFSRINHYTILSDASPDLTTSIHVSQPNGYCTRLGGPKPPPSARPAAPRALRRWPGASHDGYMDTVDRMNLLDVHDGYCSAQ